MTEPPLVTVRELDLNSGQTDTIVNKINAVPGLKTSTAFFSFLRDNLTLSPDAASSRCDSPLLGSSEPAPGPPSPASPPPPPPLSSLTPFLPWEASPRHQRADQVPPLELRPLRGLDDQEEGIRLIADSVYEMRKRASRALAFHPLCLSGLLGVLFVMFSLSYAARVPQQTVAVAGVVITLYLLIIHVVTRGYVSVAVQLRSSWLATMEGDEVLLGALLHGQVVGVLALRLLPDAPLRKKGRGACPKGGRGFIRAWTTRQGYRRRGIGCELVASAVKMTKERFGKDADIGFAQEHAHSVMILPRIFNRTFRKSEVRATMALDRALSDCGSSRKKAPKRT